MINEYVLGTRETDVVINVALFGAMTNLVNHSCNPNVAYFAHRLLDSKKDFVSLEAFRPSAAVLELGVDYAWSLSDPNKWVVCNFKSRCCKCNI